MWQTLTVLEYEADQNRAYMENFSPQHHFMFLFTTDVRAWLLCADHTCWFNSAWRDIHVYHDWIIVPFQVSSLTFLGPTIFCTALLKSSLLLTLIFSLVWILCCLLISNFFGVGKHGSPEIFLAILILEFVKTLSLWDSAYHLPTQNCISGKADWTAV
jgi:hypothetical protein